MKLPKDWKEYLLSYRLIRLRETAEMSLSEAAREIGCTKAHLWSLEDGRANNPTLNTLLAICRVYDISIQKLTEGL